MEPVEVIAVPAPLPKRSAPTEKRTKIPISERAVATSVEWRLVDHASGATKAERLPRGELCSTSDSRLDEADSLVVDYGGVDHEVEAEVIATGIQVCSIGDKFYSPFTCDFHPGFTQHGPRTRPPRSHRYRVANEGSFEFRSFNPDSR